MALPTLATGYFADIARRTASRPSRSLHDLGRSQPAWRTGRDPAPDVARPELDGCGVRQALRLADAVHCDDDDVVAVACDPHLGCDRFAGPPEGRQGHVLVSSDLIERRTAVRVHIVTLGAQLVPTHVVCR